MARRRSRLPRRRAANVKTSVMRGSLHETEFRLNPPVRLPDEAYWRLQAASLELRRQEASDARTYYDEMRRTKEEYLSRLRSIMGRKRADRIRILRKEIDERTEFLASTTIQRDEVESPTPRQKKNQDYGPPFDGFFFVGNNFFFADDSTDEFGIPSFEGEPVFAPTFPPLGSPPDPETGSVIINNAIGIKDASDFDEGLSARRAGVIKVIQMPPAAWIVWVRPQLEITAITYSGRMEEEEPEESPFFHVRQRVVLYARVWSDGVASPSVTWGALVDNHDHKLEDHSWGPSGFTGPYIGNFDQKYIPKLFPPGTWVAVEVGVKLRNHFIVDDFILKSIMNVNIAIKKIGIKLTGL